jgi:hypothetical protein
MSPNQSFAKEHLQACSQQTPCARGAFPDLSLARPPTPDAWRMAMAHWRPSPPHVPTRHACHHPSPPAPCCPTRPTPTATCARLALAPTAGARPIDQPRSRAFLSPLVWSFPSHVSLSAVQASSLDPLTTLSARCPPVIAVTGYRTLLNPLTVSHARTHARTRSASCSSIRVFLGR